MSWQWKSGVVLRIMALYKLNETRRFCLTIDQCDHNRFGPFSVSEDYFSNSKESTMHDSTKYVEVLFAMKEEKRKIISCRHIRKSASEVTGYIRGSKPAPKGKKDESLGERIKRWGVSESMHLYHLQTSWSVTS